MSGDRQDRYAYDPVLFDPIARYCKGGFKHKTAREARQCDAFAADPRPEKKDEEETR